MARPSKYRPEFVEQARKLAELGATDREVAEFFGVHEATLHRWKAEYPDLSESLKTGKSLADERVERSLYHKAIGYKVDTVKVFISNGAVIEVPFVEQYPPDTTAAIFWLKNRRPDLWRDKSHQEHTGQMQVNWPVAPNKLERKL